MAFCKNCGKQLDEDQVFCDACGTKSGETSTGANANYYTDSTGNTTGNTNGYTYENVKEQATSVLPNPQGPLSGNPVINDIKKQGSSMLFLAFVITYSIVTLAYFFRIFSGGLGQISNVLNTMENSFPYAGGMAGRIEDMLSGSFFGALFSFGNFLNFVPFAIVCFGVWTFYLSCLNTQKDTVNVKGIKAIGILYRVLFILNIVAMVIVEIIFLIMAIALMNEVGGVGAIMFLGNLIFGIYYGLSIFFCGEIRKAASNVHATATEGEFNKRQVIPTSIIVLNVLSIIGALFAGNGWVIKLFTIASLIILTVAISQYNSGMVQRHQNAPLQ